MSNFDFLTAEWNDIHEAARNAESAAIPDPRRSYSHARRALELEGWRACLIGERRENSLKHQGNQFFRPFLSNCKLAIYVKLYI